ncbi:quinol:cytochrome c oxidoreductase monoheme cytochrome subunit [Archangium gephyra]|uniref:ABC-type Fe3+ transport system protein n=1 Tax=Archangium gephyra TaxID=48 RepID=A0AAC8Q1U6_9BACT|nr:cytochrome c [Archangium gephyra]AKI98763.1 ABC-type Fe3+ transport system protein [Archangium gephyra]REG30683.1 quinol:cytochrome c oxidoreductase monoheme cytochrome subunit [Archangium gephyra]
MRRLLLVPLAWVLAGCPVDFQGWGGMKQQPKALPYRESTFFEDERVMRQPPAGTVPRNRRGQDRFFLTGKDAPDGGYVESIPLTLTREWVESGGKSFDIYCATCHGVLGDGVAQVARNMGLREPPSLVDLPEYPDGYYYDVITRGYGLMPAYAEKLTPEQRWAVVAYVRALQESQRAGLEDVPPEARPRLLKEGTP